MEPVIKDSREETKVLRMMEQAPEMLDELQKHCHTCKGGLSDSQLQAYCKTCLTGKLISEIEEG
jgi:hypothetical protein